MAKKLTIEDLIARKSRLPAESRSVYVPGLDGEITVQKLPLERMLNVMDGLDAASMKDSMAAQVDLIYAAVPMFRDKGLQDAYGCAEPSDIVYRVLNDNLGDIGVLANAVLSFYGLDEQMNELKN